MSVDSLIFFFLMLAIGYGVARLKLVPEQTADTLPGVLLNVCYPAMVLHTFTSTDPQVLLHTGFPRRSQRWSLRLRSLSAVCCSSGVRPKRAAPTGALFLASAMCPMPPFRC